MTAIALVVSEFRADCPEFGDDITYTDADIEHWFDVTGNYVTTNDYGYLTGDKRKLALYLFTAHLMYLNNKVLSGALPMPLNSADEGTVKISFTTPPAKSMWQWWLTTSPYGLQLLGLFSTAKVGGFIYGGSNVRAGIRKPNGCF